MAPTTETPTITPSHKRSPLLWAGLGAIASGLAAGGLWWWLESRSGLAPGDALGLVPVDTIAAVRISGDRRQWADLRQTGSVQLQRGLGDWLASGRDRLTALGYGTWDDLQTQLAGPVAIAWVPSGASGAPTTARAIALSAPDVLLVIPVRQPDTILGWLKARKPPVGSSAPATTYRKISLWAIQPPQAQAHVSALVGSTWLIASQPTTLQRAIDAHLDGTSLQSLGPVSLSRQRLGDRLSQQQRSETANSNTSNALLELYLNAPSASQAAIAAGRSLPIPTDLQGLWAGVQVQPTGLQITSFHWRTSAEGLGVLNGATPTPLPGGSALAERFPIATSLLWTGASVRDLWQAHSRRAQPTLNPLLDPQALRAQVKTVTGMDLEQDWLTWMDGPFAVGLLPIPSRVRSRFESGLTLMVQVSDRRAAETALKRLDGLMAQRYQLGVASTLLGGQPVTNWLNRFGEPVVTHGWLDNNVAFLVIGGPGAALLIPKPPSTLAASPLYQQGMPRRDIDDLPQPETSLFVDLDRVGKTNLATLLPLPPGSQPLLQALKTLGVRRYAEPLPATGLNGANRLTRYQLSLQFPPTFTADPGVTPPATPGSTSPATPGATLPATPGAAPGVTPPATPPAPPPATPGVTPDATLAPRPSLSSPVSPVTSSADSSRPTPSSPPAPATANAPAIPPAPTFAPAPRPALTPIPGLGTATPSPRPPQRLGARPYGPSIYGPSLPPGVLEGGAGLPPAVGPFPPLLGEPLGEP